MSLYLLFDVGNTRLKWAAVESTQKPSERQKKLWAYSGSINTKSLSSPELRAELSDYIAKTLPKPDAIGFSCVAGQGAIENLKSLFPQWSDIEWKEITGASTFQGMRTLYQDPSKLGSDRWAAVIGARALSSVNTLVVNAGTATTIDLLGANGVHYGGWILPGITLMAQTLSSNTANLPNVEKIESLSTLKPALTTDEGIEQGIFACQVGAISIAEQYAKNNNIQIDLVVLTGGNANLIGAHLEKQSCVVTEPQLALKGLLAWHLLNYPS